MKNALALCILLVCARADASPLACESIKDPDRRHYCRARTIPSRSECEFIKESDLRAECRATVQDPPKKR